jgi:hypothetical protein
MPKHKKKIYDKGKVVTGLAIFAILATFPFWYNLGKAAPAPKPELTGKAKIAKECVLPGALMKTEHMQLLDTWRDEVVRNGNRVYINPDGKAYEMSLSNTCLDCHAEKAKFCDQCHDYVEVTPYCWECHIDNPKEKK